MEITTAIVLSEIHSAELKRSNNISDYFFVTADIVCNIEYDNKTSNFCLQTGSSYHHNDYSLPTNDLSIYSDSCDDVLINMLHSETVDDNNVDYINEECETHYSLVELLSINEALNDLVIDAQQIITDAEQEAEQELEDDPTIYILGEFYERCEETEQLRQCDYPIVSKFYDQNKADNYIEKTEHTRIISKEEANSNYSEFL